MGDFLRMKSCILYTQLENPKEPLINVEVIAHVTRPELRSSEVITICFLVGPLFFFTDLLFIIFVNDNRCPTDSTSHLR